MSTPSSGSPGGFFRKHRYHIAAAAFVAVVAVLFVAGRAHHRAPAPPGKAAPGAQKPPVGSQEGAAPDTYVQAYRVKRVSFRDVLSGLTGTVRGSSIELKTPQEERLVRYRCRPGDALRKGDVIAELDHTRTQARLRQAEIELDRRKRLYSVGGASALELAQAEESLKIARKDYDDTFVVAPKNGFLGETLAQEGELVTRQTPIAYFVSAEDPFFVETSVIEKRVGSVLGGQTAVVYVDTCPGVPIKGRVLSVSPEVLTTSRMAPVRVALPAKYVGKLRPGLSARCDVTVYSADSLVVPVSALAEGRDRVFLIDGDKVVSARDVKLGYKSREYIEVVRGLAEGDVIVANADYSGVADGAKVRYSEVDEYKEPRS